MKAGWQTKTLGDACQIARGGSPRPIQDFMTNDPDGVNWVKISDATASGKFIYVTKEKIKSSGVARSRLVKPGDFLLSNSMSFGRPYIMQTTGCIHDGWLVLSDYEKCFDQGFLYHLLGSPVVFEQFDRLAAGSTVRNLNIELASRVVLPVPPLPEQQRIVTLLDEAFGGIATAKANAEKNLQNARAIFESYLDAVLSKIGDGYKETTLGAEVDLLPGYAFPSGGYTDSSGDVRLLRGDNIMQGYFRWEEEKRWPANECKPYEKFALQEGDVVLAMDRPWVKAGLKRAQVSAADLPALLVQRTSRLRPRARMRADFLAHLTGSQAFSQHLLAVQTGIGVPHISGKQIESFRFMLPSVLDQEVIAQNLGEMLSGTQRLEEIYESKLAALDDLQRSVLHQAFSGAL